MNSISTNSRLTRGYAIALVSAAILSTTAIFIRFLTQTYGLPALVLAFWRDGFVALTLLLALRLFRPILIPLKTEHLGFLLAYGLVLALFNALWTNSVAMNGAAVSTVLVYCSAAFTAILGRWVLKEHLGWAKLLAICFCLGGCVLVAEAYHASAWRANLIGILTGILSGLGYAIYSLLGRSAAQRGLNPWTATLYSFAFAAGFLLIINLLAGGHLPGTVARPADLFWLGSSISGWGVLILLAAGPTLTGFGLYNVSLSYLPSSVANLVVSCEPALTAVTAYFLFGERLTMIQIVGSLMILVGVIILRLYEGEKNGLVEEKPEERKAAFSFDPKQK
jgi:drug/metabolite transporter (DMT)-like permease